jgi:hypothetical protein
LSVLANRFCDQFCFSQGTLKRVLMSVLADLGVELPIPPDGPVVRMVDQEMVRKQFYMQTPADGTPEQKGNFRRQKFFRALAWAEDQELIGAAEINGVTARTPAPARSRKRDTCP